MRAWTGFARVGVACFAAALCCTPAHDAAADGPGHQDVGVRYRTPAQIARGLAKALPPKGVLIVLADPDAAFKSQALGKQWGAAFLQAFITRTEPGRLALARVERTTSKMVLAPTDQLRPFATAFAALDAEGTDEFRDAMSAVRDLARTYATPSVPVHIALISAANVEGEADIEGTLGALRAGRITLHVIGRGAYLSDSYWALNGTSSIARRAPKGVTLKGPEGPARELPMGWAFDRSGIDNTAPSGFGIYAFARLVAMTKGRYYLWAPPAASARSHCEFLGCTLCTGTHLHCDRVYADSYLSLMAPWLGTRVEYAQQVKGHPLWTAVANAWQAAADAGAVQTVPPALLRGTVGKGKANARSSKFLRGATGRGGWKSRAAGARKIAQALDKPLVPLRRALAATKRQDAPRAWATAATLEAQILAAQFNLRQFARFAEAVQDELRHKGANVPAGEVPVVPRVRPQNATGELGYNYTNLTFCHGVFALQQVEWLGGAAALQELEPLITVIERNLRNLQSTPYETQNRHVPLALFRAYWLVRGTGTPPPRNRGDLKDGSGATARQGPNRGGGSGGGGSSGGSGTSGG